MTRPALLAAAVLLPALACQQAQTAPLYEATPVERRNIVVTATASGVMQPILTFSVKSKAWGEIIDMRVQTGDEVKKGQLLARIDPRIPQQNLTEAQAALDKARAALTTATAQFKRADALFRSQSIAETEYDAAKLARATAAATVVTAEAALQTAKDAMDDTQVRAPITGSILELDAVLGTVISSPTLGGGTVILKMASLDTIQDSAMVAETDIGRVTPGLTATITVDAYPNRSFDGTVLKIGPQAQVVQNVTSFPVFVNIPNPGHLLKPGMNTDARIHTGRRDSVLAVPNAALRTPRDVASGAAVLGLDEQAVNQEIATAQALASAGGGPPAQRTRDSTAAQAGGPGTLTLPNGRVVSLPPGISAEQVQAAIAKMRSGGEPTAAERALLAQVFRSGGGGGGGGQERSGGTRWPGEQLHRVRPPRREDRRPADQNGIVGSGLHRGHGGTDGQGHRARPAERFARAVAAAVQAALSERDRRRAAGPAPAAGSDGWRPMIVRRLAVLLVALAACHKAERALPYQTVPVTRRDIVVSATATGVIQPILTLSVKSKASGEIIDMPVQTGDEVKKGQLLAKVDPRIPQNNLTQAQANLAVAQAQLDNATAQLKRSQALFQTQSITQAGYDSAQLAAATAQAAVVTAQANLQTMKDAMEDTHLGAPITGTVLELDAVLGTVISSPTNDVGGGTVILKMANLDTVQVSALVDETDVGKVQSGMPVTITVDAFPNRTFDGSVLKIEPQATVTQNVTMFPVEVNIPNAGHILKPGMNTEVEIHIGQRQGALAVPNAALRTPRDVASAAGVLGLDVKTVQQQLAAAAAAGTPRAGADSPLTDGGKLHAAEPRPSGATFTTPAGRVVTLPPGVTAEQVKAAFAKRNAGQELTPAEQAVLDQIRAQFQAGPGGGSAAAGGAASTGRYIVFALRGGKITAVPIRTGLTDQDYIEVTAGLSDKDTVIVLSGTGGT